MGYDNKPNLSNKQFSQLSGDTLHLSGVNIICRTTGAVSGGIISSFTGYAISGCSCSIFSTGIGLNAIKIGCNAIASAPATTVVGSSAVACAAAAISIGCNTISRGLGSIAIGTDTDVSGTCSIGLGSDSSTTANNSIVIGVSSGAAGNSSIAIGNSVLSNNCCGFTIGNWISNNYACSFGLGWYEYCKDGVNSAHAPTILFSDNNSYFLGCGNPKIGINICNPQARLDIYTTGTTCALRIVDGTQALGKVFTSDALGFGSWKNPQGITGTPYYFSMYDSGGTLTDSYLKFVTPNIIESQLTGTTVIRTKAAIEGSIVTPTLEIHSGCIVNNATDYGNVLISSNELVLSQPSTIINYSKLKSISSKGLWLGSGDNDLVLAGNIIKIGLCDGDSNIADITLSNSVGNTSIVSSSNNNLIIESHSGQLGNCSGKNLHLCAGNANNLGLIGDGGCVVISAGNGNGTGVDGRILFNDLPQRTTETCGVYIDSCGKLSYGIISGGTSTGSTNISGLANYIARFNSNGNNVETSSIFDCGISNTIVIGSESETSSTIKSRDYSTTAVNLILKSGCRLDYIGSGHQDGYVFIDPGRGDPAHPLYLGSPEYDRTSVGIIPFGTIDDICLDLSSKGLGRMNLIANGGIQLGTSTNKLCYNGTCLYQITNQHLVVSGYDSNVDNNPAGNITIKGGLGIAGNTVGGSVILVAGCGTQSAGSVKICSLPLKTSETCVVYINASGELSTGVAGVITTANNGLNIIGDNVRLGGALTGDTSISGNYTLNVNGCAKLNTTCGYQISGSTILRTSINNISTIFLGSGAGGNSNIGSDNTGIGCNVLVNNTSGSNNISMGYYSLNNNNSGSHNIAIGCYSLVLNSNSSYNVSVGSESLRQNASGSYNVSYGYQSGYNNVSGSSSVFIGKQAGYCETGSNKLHIGNSINCSLICGDFLNKTVKIDNILITPNVYNNGVLNVSVAEGSRIYMTAKDGTNNYLVLGNPSQSNVSKSVICPAGTSTNIGIEILPKGTGIISLNGQVCSTSTMTASNFILSSDCRCKTNILPIVKTPLNIEYKEFELISEPNQVRYGVIAQELQQTNPELVRSDSTGMLSVAYIDLLIKEISYLKYKVCELEKRLN